MRQLLFLMTMAALLVSVAALLAPRAADAEPIKRCRHPAISPDAKMIAFTYRGDIWTVSAEGGAATRLTVHNARDNSPIISPDGKTIAFASNRFGSIDVLTMPITGGEPKRITFSSSYEWPEAYTPDGKWILIRSGMYGGTDTYKVPVEGGSPIRITGDDWEAEYFMAVAPDMKTAAIDVQGGAGGWRRRDFESSGMADIWLVEFATPVVWKKKLTDYRGNDFNPMFSPDGKTIYYVSDDGPGTNVWKMDLDGGHKTQVTRHATDGVRNMKLALNGEKMVYEYNSEIWIADARTGEAHAVPIEAPADDRNNFLRRQVFDSANQYAVSPDGKKIALGVRGDIFLISAEDGGEAVQLTTSGWRDQDFVWDPDSYHIIFVSDRDGQRDLWKVDLRGNETRITDTPEDENIPVISLDGKYITYYFAEEEIWRMPIGGGEAETLARAPFWHAGIPSDARFRWSPDGEWLAYVFEDETYQTNIWIENVTTHEKHRLTNLTGSVDVPNWSPDGKHLTFACSQYGNNDIYVLDLFPRPIEFDEDKIEKLIAESEGQAVDEAEKEPEDNGVAFQIEGIEKRLRRIVSSDGWEGEPMYTKDGKFIIFRGGDGQVWKIGEDGKGATSLTGGAGKGGLQFSADGNRVWYSMNGRPGSVDINNRQVKDLSFRATMDIDLLAEDAQVFNEVWWILNRIFYDPNMHGVDWDAIRQKYEALLPWTPQKEDFYDMMAEMVGELNTSHLGVGGPAEYSAPISDDTAYIGVEPDWPEIEATGRFKVARVLPDSPADNEYSKLNVGDYILSIDGVDLTRDMTYEHLMDQKVGKKVRLMVDSQPTLDGAREVAIKPINRNGYGELYYECWVASRRKIAEELSGGRVGYVHIRGMNQECLQRFRRELVTECKDKAAMIVDVRYNGGGRIAHELLTILTKRPFVRLGARAYATMEEMDLLGDFWNKPAACLTNQHSGSNAEMFSEGFRVLGVGPVVGIPSAGAVISTVGWTLMDGGSVSTPHWGVYSLTGEDLEGTPRPVDYEVPYDPRTFNLDGSDPTVAKAVELMLAELAKQPKKQEFVPRIWRGSE